MAKDDYFVLAYKILRTLKAAMRVEEFDAEQISAEILHIDTVYWESIVVMLFQEGYSGPRASGGDPDHALSGRRPNFKRNASVPSPICG
jgi:hypothetical protein